jgi:hypothetical protein
MRFIIFAALIFGAIAAGLGLRSCVKPAPPPPVTRPNSAIERSVIALPNGATIVAAPGSTAAQIAEFLASHDPGPRTFEPGGREYVPWSGDPTPAAEARLNALVQLLKAYPHATATVIGHTDNIGESERNEKLSRDRAEGVVRRLVDKGISGSRLTAVGMGPRAPIAPNATVEGQARNRRISIVIAQPSYAS